ncbi:inositol polyphosphate-5-phosphatase A isoform X1 [Rhopalosiphum padi]|uniref:inositol polyphosphate-5-phosphatase A isoform X1 n=2 Tax=Rhopalosiphum padi TaxID=40932 RepID=UPI00298D829A|nr:inositol polyphosphate-5-phosphatase A isoform X1 [Rhopalosiphum padi]
MACESSTRVLLVTANIGSIFENPSVMLKIWTEEFLNTVSRLDPYFIALHCQEVGGKNYEESMKHVNFFVSLLMTSKELRIFNRAQVFLDEEFTSAENFTALGNFYFIHEAIKEASIWDFNKQEFLSVTEKTIYSGNIEDVSTKEKSKFPQDFFPECKWSRKGFLRTRWKLNGSVFDLINIHLFHDASNFTAMQSHSSVYSIMRQKALEYTLDRFRNYEFGFAPFFLFGDFNFRTDTKAVIMKIVEGLDMVKDDVDKDNLVFQYTDNSKEVIFTLRKKEFRHLDHQNIFVSKSGSWLKDFDHELKSFEEQLFEFPIYFQPSYPFEENEHEGMNYMQTRCPAWCDRVVLSAGAKLLINEKALEEDNNGEVEYDLIGKKTCMGDHKPVYLKCDIMNNAGIVDRVDCACKLNRVPPETQNPLHALLGDHLCVDSNECCISVVDTIVPDNTVLGEVKIPPVPSTSTDDCDFDIVPLKQNYTESHCKTNKPFTCGFLRKKISDKHGTHKSIFPVSNCICKTHKWKFPMIMQKAWKHNRRIRLKSIPSLNNMPLQRYQSHHSSSDEDWFEEIADDETNNCDDKKNKCISNSNIILTNDDNCSVNFDNQSEQVATNKFKWCSSFAFRKFCDKRPLTEKKIAHRNPTTSCRII